MLQEEREHVRVAARELLLDGGREAVRVHVRRRADRRLLREVRAPHVRVAGQDVHVQLGDEWLRPGGPDRRECGIYGGQRRVVEAPVPLLADPVDAQALRLQPLDEAHGGVPLGRLPEVVVVVVELRVGVGLVGELEGLREVVLADRLEPGCLPQRPVLVEGLVHDVPAADAAAVAAHDRRDVVPQAGEQRVAVGLLPALAGEDPGGRLLVPQQHVAHHEHPVASAELDVPVGRLEVVAIGLGVDGLPLEHVLGGDRVEVAEGDGEPGIVLAVGLGPVEGDADPQAGRRQRLERRRLRGGGHGREHGRGAQQQGGRRHQGAARLHGSLPGLGAVTPSTERS